MSSPTSCGGRAHEYSWIFAAESAAVAYRAVFAASAAVQAVSGVEAAAGPQLIEQLAAAAGDA